ncbi:MAG: VWA containing CoxE family protein, partial [Bacillota bacterium]|nr:VWA containing CoxE family protein [Bacillota bacterium]
MFTSFFYLLRARGLKVSMNEWMSLIEALDKGLHNSSFTGFYYLARAILVKSEADFDKFDGAFLEYFKEMERAGDELPKELLDWLNKPREELDGSFSEEDLLRNMGLS